jgi:hypothetical protein
MAAAIPTISHVSQSRARLLSVNVESIVMNPPAGQIGEHAHDRLFVGQMCIGRGLDQLGRHQIGWKSVRSSPAALSEFGLFKSGHIWN